VLHSVPATALLRTNSRHTTTDNPGQVFCFLCSPEAIELIVSYATYGTEQELISTCKKIITKIQDEGSRKMIKLLADATPIPMNFELLEVHANE
jgi:hypothetical protein